MTRTISFFFVLFTTLFLSSEAQEIDYDLVILPENATDLTIEEELVRLAWKNNPIKSLSQNSIEAARRGVNLAEASWLENIRVTGNVNEFVINPSRDVADRAQFFPLYNVSASIPLGIFFTNPQYIKLSKIEYQNQLINLNQQKLLLRSKVLSLYEEYKLNAKINSLNSEILENAYNSFILVEENFKNGETSLENYNQAYETYKRQQINKLNAEKDLEISIISLEEIIGVDLEFILDQ